MCFESSEVNGFGEGICLLHSGAAWLPALCVFGTVGIATMPVTLDSGGGCLRPGLSAFLTSCIQKTCAVEPWRLLARVVVVVLAVGHVQALLDNWCALLGYRGQ